MASTTPNKKEIVDFLWEWAADNDWAKLLVHKVVRSESNLQPSEREEVFKYFLQAISLEKGLPVLSIARPSYSLGSKQVELTSLFDVTGVNKLAKDQIIHFSPNMTVIYGENGTGKTGYGRILKALGFSYDQSSKIYSDIFGTPQQQTAKIKYKANEVEGVFSWDGNNTNKDLGNISVFNNSCVQISLDESRHLIVSPIGFHLFNIVSAELRELDKLYKAKRNEFPTAINWIDSLNTGTPQQHFISTLSKDASEEAFNEISVFNAEDDKKLQAYKVELSKLNKSLLRGEIQSLRSQIGELTGIVNEIDNVRVVLNDTSWNQLITINKNISELEKSTQKGIAEIANSKGGEFYESEEFKTFLNAAEAYIKKLNKPMYPQDSDVCVYCQQPLEEEAKDLLSNYRKLLNDTTEENLGKQKNAKALLQSKIRELNTSFRLSYPSFGSDEDGNVIQPTEFKQFSEEVTTIKNRFIGDEVAETSVFELKYGVFQKFINDKIHDLETELKAKIDSFDNIETKETELKTKIAELEDRKFLYDKRDEVLKIIENYKVIDILNKHANAFNTGTVSRKTSQAREELIGESFIDIFQQELKALRKSSLPIDLSFGTDRGNTKLNHQINSHQLLEILSEGEQKAIALAEFLTELQLDNVKAPIIFDDPVNSLDHKIIDSVGKRLIRLSKDRQVIIFTHSILFLNSLIQQSELPTNKQEGVHFNFLSVRTNFGVTGIVDEVEEINSYSYYVKKLEKVLKTSSEGQDEARLAAEGYGHLRSAIEVSVETDILQRSIKRYSKGVAFPSFLRVQGSMIDQYKGDLNDIYEKCCTSIAGHSSPEEVPSTPTIEELKVDFDFFKEIRKKFTH